MRHSAHLHRRPFRAVRTGPSATLLIALLLVAGAPAIEAQDVRERTPNLTGGWVAEPGSVHFHLLHRFWMVSRNVANSPTMLVTAPLPGRTLVGARYASNSGIAGEANEGEIFLRWAVPVETLPVEPALTGAFNSAAQSVDGELSLSMPTERGRILGSARVFSDAVGSGEMGWALAGGAVVDLTDNVAFAADYGAAWVDGDRARPVWGAGLHLRIPTTPHTLSLQATNTPTSTLQGSSFRGRRAGPVWGFEFTIPITFARYRSRPAVTVEPVPADAGIREITMTDGLRFSPEVLEVPLGETIVWRNTTSVPHTVTADPDRVDDRTQVALPAAAEPFDSGSMAPGEVFRHTFTVPGEYRYVCVPHDSAPMIGTIRVVP